MRRISIFKKDEGGGPSVNRPNYRQSDRSRVVEQEVDLDAGLEDHRQPEQEQDEDVFLADHEEEENQQKLVNIEASAGTNRLNRILRSTSTDGAQPKSEIMFGGHATEKIALEKVGDVGNLEAVGNFCGKVVIPPLKVDSNSIGGQMLDGYPESLLQECLFVGTCQTFESTGAESAMVSALQYPNDYAKHKRSLGMFIKGGQRSRKVRFVVLARSTNRPLLESTLLRQQQKINQKHHNENDKQNDEDQDLSERADYDAMFAPDNEEEDDLSSAREYSVSSDPAKEDPHKKKSAETNEQEVKKLVILPEEEISSFPVLICVTMQHDGSGPDIRKLISLDQLTTVQDLHSTVVQLAFSNGDTIRLDFGGDDDRNKVVERSLDKERFVWSLLQIHSMLCMAVVERNSRGTSFLPPLNVRNLDRAELQYIATVNSFLKKDQSLNTLLERQRVLIEADNGAADAKNRDMDAVAYDLLMGNFTTQVTLFHSDEERKDAEEIFNSPEWTNLLTGEDSTAVNVADRLAFMLQSRMRDLEAETCRRLIAWEDEKHLSHSGSSKLHTDTDSRDTVDALALASLFKTLESLDSELGAMENWLQERAAAIKPLTDDCSEIEKENRDLEQQWKSYETLGSEMSRLLHGHEISESTDTILKNPAAALVYDEDGLVDIEDSEEGIERIYEAGKALLDAIEFPRKSGGMHLRAVSERARGHTSIKNTYCTALAQIVVTVMEQFKSEVVAGSDYGKVSKNDTHTMIAKKVKETQRSFQSSLLSYIKLIEILSALSPDMLPALRESYAEMVAEGIMMKKRMKGYFQALPGKNTAYMHCSGKDLKDYVPFDETLTEETVNAPDIRAALSEILPVIAREAHFTSALFGASNKDQDGREKKRNFENAKKAVDKASQNFRYYMNRTCGIVESNERKTQSEQTTDESRGDPLLSLVASISLVEAMDNYIDREKKGGDHSLSLAYVRATILDLRKKADKQWVGWVDKQIKWIKSHDGVPVSGKRAGIFPSFYRFPIFLDHVLLCCKEERDSTYEPDLPGIKVVNFYLQKMVVTMLESLKDCSNRETTDQAYAANVMQMENTYFLTEAIKQRGEMIGRVFKKQVTKANAICKESTDSYLGWMIKREFAALHDLFSRISKIRKELGDLEVTSHVPKSQFVKTLQKEANREILKEKISTMYSRMEKHLCEEGSLLPVAWKTLVKVLYEWFGRWDKLCGSIYRHKLDPGPVDIVRIAKAAGGEAKPKSTPQPGEFGFKSILALGK